MTGYRDFSYAQEAIRLGVTRFLLKPTKMAEINEALEAMTAKLKEPSAKPQEEPPEEEEKHQGAGSFLVDSAVSYMREHYQEKLTLQEVADRCYVSQWHLSKLLNKYMEMSFYDILNSIRIENAKRLLENPGLKIGQIGEMVGYADAAHFTRTFKKLEGINANEYRNRMRNS